MHICSKNIIVSEHGFEHVSYVTWYIFGEVTEEENKRNGGGRQILRSFFTAIWPKGGNVTFENWELKISKFWMVEGNLDLLFPPPPQRLKTKKYCSFSSEAGQLEECFGGVLPFSSCIPVCPLEMERESWQIWVLPSLPQLEPLRAPLEITVCWQRLFLAINHHLSRGSREEQNFITCK